MNEPPPFRGDAVRGIVFDLDGTLVDSYGPIAESLNHARVHFDLPPLPAATIRGLVGRGLESLIAERVGPDRVEVGVRLFRERYAGVFENGTFALGGVAATLETLAAGGYRMAVASNKPARYSERILEKLALRRHFRCVLGPDLVAHPKPDPAMIHACLDQLGLTPARSVYVGDMVLDVESAARAHVPVLLVAGGSSDAAALDGTGQLRLASFERLAELLPRAALD